MHVKEICTGWLYHPSRSGFALVIDGVSVGLVTPGGSVDVDVDETVGETVGDAETVGEVDVVGDALALGVTVEEAVTVGVTVGDVVSAGAADGEPDAKTGWTSVTTPAAPTAVNTTA
ncbi:MAG TPA: hypothetical protein VG899_10915 [Mycobacteriales bacterium]|nr:hypothetical protein [Mycobacteriales bacterium]